MLFKSIHSFLVRISLHFVTDSKSKIVEMPGSENLLKVAFYHKGFSKYPLYPISLQFFLQISCSQLKLRFCTQISTPSQSQAPSKKQKVWASGYLHKPYREKATLNKQLLVIILAFIWFCTWKIDVKKI